MRVQPGRPGETDGGSATFVSVSVLAGTGSPAGLRNSQAHKKTRKQRVPGGRRTQAASGGRSKCFDAADRQKSALVVSVSLCLKPCRVDLLHAWAKHRSILKMGQHEFAVPKTRFNSTQTRTQERVAIRHLTEREPSCLRFRIEKRKNVRSLKRLRCHASQPSRTHRRFGRLVCGRRSFRKSHWLIFAGL